MSKPKPSPHSALNEALHLRAQRDRLLAANERQAQDILALVVGMREAHALLADRSSGRTDAQRIELASKHLAGVIVRTGHSLAAPRAYSRASS